MFSDNFIIVSAEQNPQHPLEALGYGGHFSQMRNEKCKLGVYLQAKQGEVKGCSLSVDPPYVETEQLLGLTCLPSAALIQLRFLIF